MVYLSLVVEFATRTCGQPMVYLSLVVEYSTLTMMSNK